MATIRDNVVMIKCDTLASLNVVPNSLIVTSGQPLETNVESILEHGIATIRVRAGRKKSKPVAQEFVRRSGGRGHMKATYLGISGVPDELNYAFTVNAKLKSGADIILEMAQGSSMGRNNHWMGSKLMVAGEIAYLEVDNVRLKVQGTSLESYTGEKFNTVVGALPVQLQPVASFLGSVFDKAFFSSVNVFTLTELS